MNTVRHAARALTLAPLLAPTLASAQGTTCQDVPEGTFGVHGAGSLCSVVPAP